MVEKSSLTHNVTTPHASIQRVRCQDECFLAYSEPYTFTDLWGSPYSCTSQFSELESGYQVTDNPFLKGFIKTYLTYLSKITITGWWLVAWNIQFSIENHVCFPR